MTLTRALQQLSAEHREVLVLRFVADLSEAQVAAVLGVPAGTVKSRVARAIARIDTEALRRAIS
ncbi:MAG: sigma-70 family RNA polymerase sigma factor [Nocardioides sp.]|uniref:RNA polymerase sigma factor n=1 Tax=Nocardioides sp. TaxID=35761 RepID=UPI0039E6858F